MAITKIDKSGYGQIELNHVAWRRDGRIRAQARLDPTDFNTVTVDVNNEIKAENGMVLRIDPLTNTLKFPRTADKNAVYGINYSSEYMYDERTKGLKNFYLDSKGVLPRLGLPAIGDVFTTNTLVYDTAEIANLETLKTESILYGVVDDDSKGYIKLTNDSNLFDNRPANGLLFIVREQTTMPDGQFAVKLEVIGV